MSMECAMNGSSQSQLCVCLRVCVPVCVCACVCVCVESIKQSYVVMMATNARECASAWATSGQITVLATVGGTRIMGMDKVKGTRDAP